MVSVNVLSSTVPATYYGGAPITPRVPFTRGVPLICRRPASKKAPLKKSYNTEVSQKYEGAQPGQPWTYES